MQSKRSIAHGLESRFAQLLLGWYGAREHTVRARASWHVSTRLISSCRRLGLPPPCTSQTSLAIEERDIIEDVFG